MSNSVAGDLSLIIPLALLLLTLGWWGWVFHRRSRGS